VDLTVAAAPSEALEIGRWPGWVSLTIMFGGSAVLWSAIAWATLGVLKLV
jgi:hypothetical protein